MISVPLYIPGLMMEWTPLGDGVAINEHDVCRLVMLDDESFCFVESCQFGIVQLGRVVEGKLETMPGKWGVDGRGITGSRNVCAVVRTRITEAEIT